MRVLLIGSGGREHALAVAMLASPRLTELFVAPGNAGTAAHNVDLDTADHASVTEFCGAMAIDLVVVGPEAPLVAGLADELTGTGVACFGPSAAAARLEGSKSFTRSFAASVGIPQPEAATFDDAEAAIAWLDQIGVPVVVKADGLAAGKGVVIPETRAATEAAIRDMLEGGAFGEAGSTIVLEERMVGEELSLFGVSDGTTVVALATEQDHTRVGEGDTGPNTGGMGAFAPVPGIDAERQSELAELFLRPAVDGMAAAGTPYVGVLFAGLMLTETGPKLVEFNCRFGDPEAEVILPLVESDVLTLVHAAAVGQLASERVEVSSDVAATVVVAADGYPADPIKGVPVRLPDDSGDVTIFHAGTRIDDDRGLVSSGGRVLSITGRGADLDAALDAAYAVVDEVTGDGLFARGDIGWRHRRRPAQQRSAP